MWGGGGKSLCIIARAHSMKPREENYFGSLCSIVPVLALEEQRRSGARRTLWYFVFETSGIASRPGNQLILIEMFRDFLQVLHVDSMIIQGPFFPTCFPTHSPIDLSFDAIKLSTLLLLLSLLLVLIFRFIILYIVCRTPWTGD
jgi:hypothetical protein